MLIAPYIASRTGESADHSQVVAAGGILRFLDERPADRDRWGVLWTRQPTDLSGRPEYGRIHSARQRHAALLMLCQVCGEEPDEDDSGVLWLLPSPVASLRRAADPIRTPYPPICLRCKENALRMCPPLRERHALLRVTDVDVYGVRGILHEIRGQELRQCAFNETVSYHDPRVCLILAIQQVLSLNDYRVLSGAG